MQREPLYINFLCQKIQDEKNPASTWIEVVKVSKEFEHQPNRKPVGPFFNMLENKKRIEFHPMVAKEINDRNLNVGGIRNVRLFLSVPGVREQYLSFLNDLQVGGVLLQPEIVHKEATPNSSLISEASKKDLSAQEIMDIYGKFDFPLRSITFFCPF